MAISKYVERLEEIGQDGYFGDVSEAAIEAIENRINPDVDDDMSLLEAEHLYARTKKEREFFDEVSDIVRKLADVVNVMGREKDLALAMYRGLTNQHRTLQAGLIRTFIDMLRIYSDTAYDLRNAGAVAASQIITEAVDEAGVSIPLI